VDDKKYEHDIVEVAERVKAIRESLKMSQPQFAEWIGYSADTISKLERGLRGISGEMTAAISLKTGISSDYILYGKLQDDLSLDTRKQVKKLLNESIELLDYQ